VELESIAFLNCPRPDRIKRLFGMDLSGPSFSFRSVRRNLSVQFFFRPVVSFTKTVLLFSDFLFLTAQAVFSLPLALHSDALPLSSHIRNYFRWTWFQEDRTRSPLPSC